MQDSDETGLMEILQRCETSIWDALVDGDKDVDDALLHPDFLGVYPDGFAGKTDHVSQLSDGATVERYTLSCFRLLTLGTHHAVLSYRADFLRKERRDFEVMYVSSIWQRVVDGWVNVFSQDTPADSA